MKYSDLKITIPKKYLPKFKNEVVVARGRGNVLWVYEKKNWEKMFGRLKKSEMSKETIALCKIIKSNIFTTKIDSERKITLPRDLCKYAKIKDEKVEILLDDEMIIIKSQ